jgi:hypothetical protein
MFHEELDRLETLERDWARPWERPLSAEALETTRRLLTVFEQRRVEPDRIAPYEQGARFVFLDQRGGSTRRATVAALPDGSVSVLLEWGRDRRTMTTSVGGLELLFEDIVEHLHP